MTKSLGEMNLGEKKMRLSYQDSFSLLFLTSLFLLLSHQCHYCRCLKCFQIKFD